MNDSTPRIDYSDQNGALAIVLYTDALHTYVYTVH